MITPLVSSIKAYRTPDRAGNAHFPCLVHRCTCICNNCFSTSVHYSLYPPAFGYCFLSPAENITERETEYEQVSNGNRRSNEQWGLFCYLTSPCHQESPGQGIGLYRICFSYITTLHDYDSYEILKSHMSLYWST